MSLAKQKKTKPKGWKRLPKSKNSRSLPAKTNGTWVHTGSFANELSIEQQQSPFVDIRSEEDVYLRVVNKSTMRREAYMEQVAKKQKGEKNENN